MLRGAASIRALRLGDNGIGACGVGMLAAALKQNDTLLALGLGDNDLGPAGAACIADALCEQSRWFVADAVSARAAHGGSATKAAAAVAARELAYAEEAISVEEATGGPPPAAGATGRGLTSLDLRSNGLGTQGLATLAGALRGNGRLATLNLWGNGLDETAAARGTCA